MGSEMCIRDSSDLGRESEKPCLSVRPRPSLSVYLYLSIIYLLLLDIYYLSISNSFFIFISLDYHFIPSSLRYMVRAAQASPDPGFV